VVVVRKVVVVLGRTVEEGELSEVVVLPKLVVVVLGMVVDEVVLDETVVVTVVDVEPPIQRIRCEMSLPTERTSPDDTS